MSANEAASLAMEALAPARWVGSMDFAHVVIGSGPYFAVSFAIGRDYSESEVNDAIRRAKDGMK